VAADVDMLGAQETVRLAQIAVQYSSFPLLPTYSCVYVFLSSGGNGTGKTVVVPLRVGYLLPDIAPGLIISDGRAFQRRNR
jgi:hypothetical protein